MDHQVTLIPSRLFNKSTEVELLSTTYKFVNNQKIEFTSQTKAMVKTNKETLKLPLLITKTSTALLLGLGWMQQLGIHLKTSNSEIQIYHLQLGCIEEKITDLKNKLRDLFYNNNERKDLSVKINPKEGAQMIQSNGRLIRIHL